MATDPRESLRKRFGQLVVEWKTGCGSSSDFNEMILHPAYQQIIGMGHAVLPLLFEELESAPDHWFWALTAITGVDPVLVQAHGFREAVEAWLAWGRVNKYL